MHWVPVANSIFTLGFLKPIETPSLCPWTRTIVIALNSYQGLYLCIKCNWILFHIHTVWWNLKFSWKIVCISSVTLSLYNVVKLISTEMVSGNCEHVPNSKETVMLLYIIEIPRVACIRPMQLSVQKIAN